MRTTKLLKTAMAGAVALLAACNDSTGGSGTGPGSLSFSYSGDRVGSYSASGTYRPRGSSFDKVPFAVGVRSSGSDLAVLSYQPVTSTTGDMVLLAVSGVSQTGSYSLASDNCGSNDCPLALLLFDTNPDLEEDDSQVFAFSSGTLNVTSISSGRMTGTFSGTAETFFADSVITISNGSFDLPVRSGGVLATRSKAERQLSRHAKPE
ncbi:MAG TPA: hypothetical protein VFS20_33435 [Longimicrobium sp.]|nr:hypothetical protein [Longimicrobium sp.]